MGAAVALARKVADAITKIPDWFLSKIDSRGWTAMPSTAIEYMDRKLNPTEGSIYRNIYRLTVGNRDQRRTDQIRITHDEFSQWANVDKRHITNALKFLRDNNVIQAEERGRYVLYSILDFQLTGLPDRKPRTLDRDGEDQEETVETVDDPTKEWETVVFHSKNPMKRGGTCKIKLPREKMVGYVSWKDDLNLAPGEVRGEFKKTHLEMAINLSGLVTTDHGTRVPRSKGEEKDKGTPVPSSLLQEFVPVYENYFHQKPDDALIKRIVGDLGKTPASYFVHVIVWPKLQSRYKVLPGLLPELAKEAAEKWAKLSPDLQRGYLPRAIEKVMTSSLPDCSEPLSSGSAWMKIRLRLQDELHPVEYDNWFVHTMFESFKSGHLVVRVASDLVRDFLAQEYQERIEETAKALHLNVQSIRFVPVEE